MTGLVIQDMRRDQPDPRFAFDSYPVYPDPARRARIFGLWGDLRAIFLVFRRGGICGHRGREIVIAAFLITTGAALAALLVRGAARTDPDVLP